MEKKSKYEISTIKIREKKTRKIEKNSKRNIKLKYRIIFKKILNFSTCNE